MESSSSWLGDVFETIEDVENIISTDYRNRYMNRNSRMMKPANFDRDATAFVAVMFILFFGIIIGEKKVEEKGGEVRGSQIVTVLVA